MSFQAIRGMNDILPQQIPYWEHLETTLIQCVKSYGYQEIRFPILEKTELFTRTIGEVTDIVEKEMYTFTDRNSDSLTMRPEGTASCVRAGIEQGLLYNQIQRLWYMGPMFRHERPQKGRYRQFHQLGVEAFGLAGPDIDVELICLSARFWQRLGLKDIQLQINTLGSSTDRENYLKVLVDYLKSREKDLDKDSLRRMNTNPMRTLDSKNPAMEKVIADAPKLMEYLCEESKTHFSELCALLDAIGQKYELNSHMVRGLDYYSHTVFEWVTESLGAQGTVCAGGRYDALVEQLGGKATAATGFALGLERLVELLMNQQSDKKATHLVDAYVIIMGDYAQCEAMVLTEECRNVLPGLVIVNHCGGGNFKKQFKRADQSGATVALVFVEDEIASGEVTVKYLRDPRPQQTLNQSQLIQFLGELRGDHSN